MGVVRLQCSHTSLHTRVRQAISQALALALSWYHTPVKLHSCLPVWAWSCLERNLTWPCKWLSIGQILQSLGILMVAIYLSGQSMASRVMSSSVCKLQVMVASRNSRICERSSATIGIHIMTHLLAQVLPTRPSLYKLNSSESSTIAFACITAVLRAFGIHHK